MKILFLILLLVSLSIIGIQQDISAEMMGMSLTAEASEGSDTILIRGQTASQVTDVMLTVTSPDGFNRIAMDQVTPDVNGKFSTIFKINPLWKQNGFYTITAMQSVNDNSLYTLSVEVEVINERAVETLVTESNLETGLFVPELENLSMKGLTMRANALEGSTNIGITGHSDRTNIDITLKVIAPNGNVLSSNQITPNLDGKFTFEITIDRQLWTQDGIYKVTAQQGESSDHKVSIEVEIVNGVVIGGSKSVPPTDPPHTTPASDAVIIVTIQGDPVFYLDSPNAIIRGNVEILDFSPSDGLYFMKVTHIPTQKVLKDFEIYPKFLGDDKWGTQIAYPILDTDIQFGGQTLYGEFQIDVTSELGLQTGSASFFIFESQVDDKSPTPKIPEWIKNNAAWWAGGLIDDQTFVSGIQFLIKEKILNVPTDQGTSSNTDSTVPEWIKNNADWWARGLISENDFLKGIEYLVQNGIIDVNDGNRYEVLPREWQTSGPFSIDRSQYALGEKIFLRIDGLSLGDKGQVAVMRPLNSTHYSVYLTIPFDGSNKGGFNYYLDPQLSKTRGLCSVDDVLGKWALVFRGTNYPSLNFEMTNEILPGTDWNPVC